VLSDVIDSRIADIDARIKRVQDKASDEIASLTRSKIALTQARGVVTPQLDKAVAALQAIGLLQELV
jgi:hypothetical protein